MTSIMCGASPYGGVALTTDSASGDAFGRFRVSEPTTLFASSCVYDTQALLWENVVASGGGAAHDADTSTVALTVDESGDSIVRQSKQWMIYRPGKSLLVAITFNFNGADTNVEKEVGYGDGNDGIALVASGSSVSLVLRSTSGDTTVAQTSWNVDKFDGTGPSKKKIDWTKSQILLMDFQWLGVGRVRVGFDIDGVFYIAHQFLNANNISTTYMRSASLPLRYRIEATGEIAATSTLTQICCMAASEGGFEPALGIPRSASNGITTIGVTTRRPILSVRPKLTFNSIGNRALIVPVSVDLTASTNTSYWELVYNGALTNASFASVGTNSFCERDVAATAITGGEVIASGYVLSGSGSSRGINSSSLTMRLPLTVSVDESTSTPLTLVCTSFTGTSNVSGTINWEEYT